MLKVTPEIIEEIREMRSRGITQKDIAEHFNTSEVIIRKYQSDESIRKFKEKVKAYNQRPEVHKRKAEYIKKYMMNRYHSDPKWRKYFLKLVVKSYSNRYFSRRMKIVDAGDYIEIVFPRDFIPQRCYIKRNQKKIRSNVHKNRWKNDPEYRKRCLERTKKWQKEHPDKFKEMQKRYRKKHIEKFREYARKYWHHRYHTDPEFRKKVSKKRKLRYKRQKERENVQPAAN